ncbi:MAG: hypothetical protein KDK51_07020 [Deltaproteobacteria bacterium]|nr:hypothetical protein [Deltaproteobacteria bacterium]
MNKQHLFFSLALVIFGGYLGFTNCGTTSIMQNNDPGMQDQAFDPRSALEVPLDIKNRRESLDPASAEEQAGGDSGQIATLVTQIETGHDHTCIVDFMGKVRCFGYNGSGQLGLGDIENRGDESGEMGSNLPVVDLGTGMKATQIAAGADHTCALLENQKVKCWGDNTSGQLGLGDTIRRGGIPGQMGDNLPFVNLGGEQKVIQISAGYHFTCALLENHKVKCWGYNGSGILGLGDTQTRGTQASHMGSNLPFVDLGSEGIVTQISSGNIHTCALIKPDLDASGKVKCWGYNGVGQLGLGDTVHRGNQISQMGSNLPFVNLGSLSNMVTKVDTDGNTTCVIVAGKVKCWGFNGSGQLGLEDTDTRGDQVSDMGNNLPFAPIVGGNDYLVRDIDAGINHVCAIVELFGSVHVKCWGFNGSGQLGLGDTDDRGDQAGEMGKLLPSVDLGTSYEPIQISAGKNHSCVLIQTQGTEIKCWGKADKGQIGTNNTYNKGDDANEMGTMLPFIVFM